MRIGAGYLPSFLYSTPHIYVQRGGTTYAATSSHLQKTNDTGQLRSLAKLMANLRQSLQEIRKSLRGRAGVGVAAPASVSSAVDLGLAGATAAYLESTAEVNATPTSFSAFGPDWSGSSTALATIDGAYDGSNGTGTLTFEVTKGGVHGASELKIKVLKPDGRKLQDIIIGKNDPIDRQYVLQNGLVFTLGAGELMKNDTFTVEVFDTVGSVVDPDKPLDGSRNDNPNLEYGLAVTPGSFTINGAAIDVFSGDTLNSVLGRITSSAAGVTATFDPAREMVTLIQKTPGAAETIVLGGDSSGFLAAAKLAGASAVAGRDPDADEIMIDVPRFATVQNGSISLNGVGISLDVQTDSLQDVLDRINASAAGVTASVDPTGRWVSFLSDDPGEPLVLDDGGTGFFAAVAVEAGIYKPPAASGASLSRHQTHKIADVFKDFSELLNELYGDGSTATEPHSLLLKLRGEIHGGIKEAFDSDRPRLRTRFGIAFDFRQSASRVSKFDLAEQRRLISALHRGPRSVQNLLIGPGSPENGGIVGNLLAILDDAESELHDYLGSSGNLIDTVA